MRAVARVLCLAVLLAAATMPVSVAFGLDLLASWRAAEGVTQDTFQYLLTPGTNLAADPDAQRRWLAQPLLDSLREAAAAVAEAEAAGLVEGPDPQAPDNGTFLDSWDLPSDCRVGSASTDMHRGASSFWVDVLCTWGEDTNYPGASRSGIADLSWAEGRYRLVDIYWESNEYAPATTLRRELQILRDEARALLHKK